MGNIFFPPFFSYFLFFFLPFPFCPFSPSFLPPFLISFLPSFLPYAGVAQLTCTLGMCAWLLDALFVSVYVFYFMSLSITFYFHQFLFLTQKQDILDRAIYDGINTATGAQLRGLGGKGTQTYKASKNFFFVKISIFYKFDKIKEWGGGCMNLYGSWKKRRMW